MGGVRPLCCGGFAASLLLCAPLAEAGAWTLDLGQRQVISSLVIDRANRQFGPELDRDASPNFSKIESGFYVEYGVRPDLTVIGQAAYQTVSFDNGTEQTNFDGFGNLSLGLRYAIVQTDKHVVSAEVHGIINGGGEDIPDGDFGRGQTSVEFRGLYGRNVKFGRKDGFLDAQFGLRPRLNNDPLEWRVDLSAGVQVSDKLLLIGQGFYTQNNGTDRNPLDPVLPTKSIKAQASFVYWLRPKHGLQIGAFKTLWGQNVVEEEALLIGLWQRF
jgi:hypothetical protein